MAFYSTWTNFAEHPKLQITMCTPCNRVTRLCSFQKLKNDKHQNEKWIKENCETKLNFWKYVKNSSDKKEKNQQLENENRNEKRKVKEREKEKKRKQ